MGIALPVPGPPEYPEGFCQCCDPDKTGLVRVWIREGFECCYECAHELKKLPGRLTGDYHDPDADQGNLSEADWEARVRYFERGEE
jgi:hypothetical protein